MTEDELKILKAQMIDLNSKVKKLGMFNKFIEAIKLKQYETILAFIIIASIGYSAYHIEKHITASSIKSSNSIKKQIKDNYAIQNRHNH